LKGLTVLFFASSVLMVIVYRFVPVYFTPFMAGRYIHQSLFEEKVIFKKQWVNIDEVSPWMMRSVMASEDQLFLTHWGFDLGSIQKAWENNQKRNKKVKGASTISQQVAKNVFLWHGRSYLRKALEAYFTLLIEVFWSKQRIMEVYLNVAEWGNGVYGVRAASWLYFGVMPERLSASQSALMAAVLPNPRKWSPKKPSNYIQKRKAWIMRNSNMLDWKTE
jgi:monofunctional biosynthetic peptidoglycan transglycosylase